MRVIVAVDPGNEKSAVVVYDRDAKKLIFSIKCANRDALVVLREKADAYPDAELAIEMVASYGMPVGRSVFDTCVWVGRFLSAWGKTTWRLIVRKDIKMHLCATPRANDANIRQALIDRYGGSPNVAIGSKKNPGPMYRLGNDERAALALAITAAETDNVYERGGNDETKEMEHKE